MKNRKGAMFQGKKEKDPKAEELRALVEESLEEVRSAR